MTHSIHKIWDPLVRLFHWSLVAGFAANALVTDPESNLHEYIGLTLAGLIGARLLWGLIGTKYARFGQFMPARGAINQQIDDILHHRATTHLGHSPLGALMIFNLIATIAGIAATGYMMTTNAFWGVDWVEEVHEVLVTWAELSILLHVGAVLWETRRTGVNLAGAMVTGVKSIPTRVNFR